MVTLVTLACRDSPACIKSMKATMRLLHARHCWQSYFIVFFAVFIWLDLPPMCSLWWDFLLRSIKGWGLRHWCCTIANQLFALLGMLLWCNVCTIHSVFHPTNRDFQLLFQTTRPHAISLAPRLHPVFVTRFMSLYVCTCISKRCYAQVSKVPYKNRNKLMYELTVSLKYEKKNNNEKIMLGSCNHAGFMHVHFMAH